MDMSNLSQYIIIHFKFGGSFFFFGNFFKLFIWNANIKKLTLDAKLLKIGTIFHGDWIIIT
jgi:hypothetical protein